jgi:peroxiredoxin
MRKSRVFWVLVALTVITAALGLWRWQGSREEAARRLAEQSKPSLEGPSQSRAPDFALQGLDGETVSLASLRGKVVLLNFWATWCPPCKAEMPDLDALHREYGAAHDFVVVGVNVEEKPETVKPFVEKNGLSFPIVLDRDSRVTTQLFGVRPLPTTLIIDREGYIRDAWNGQIASEAVLARLNRVW